MAHSTHTPPLVRFAKIYLCLLPAIAMLLALPAAPAAARKHSRGEISAHSRVAATGKPHRTRVRLQRFNRVVDLAANSPLQTPVAAPSTSSGSGSILLDAGFENGLANWNTAGAGDAIPTVVSDTARTGTKSCEVVLTGTQERSELILGGNGGGSTAGMREFREGAEYWYGFSFDIQQMVYGKPGAHNLIMQFKSDGEGSPNFGLQLWNYAGDGGVGGGKGLWSTGAAMGGDRFLAPVSEQQWHDVAIQFKASSIGAGFYQVYLDGRLVDSRSNVSMIVPGHSYGYIKNGLYRNGDAIPGTSEIRLDAAKLGTSLSSISPG